MQIKQQKKLDVQWFHLNAPSDYKIPDPSLILLIGFDWELGVVGKNSETNNFTIKCFADWSTYIIHF